MELEEQSRSKTMKKLLLVLNCAMLGLGNTGGPLLTRLYFVHGGRRIWLSSCLLTAAWPLNLLPLSASYFFHSRRHQKPRTVDNDEPAFAMNRRLLVAAVAIGILYGVTDYLYAYGGARLPVSTSTLIAGSQLAFTAVGAFLLVRQRFTAFSVNAVVLLTAGAAVLALRASGDRPAGESQREYFAGFGMMVAAVAMNGVSLPLVELTYQKAKQRITYGVVMQIQTVVCFVATAFCTVGMAINHDFQVIAREAREYELGEVRYYVVLAWTAIIWQLFFMGAIGVVFCSSSLLSGILVAVTLPLTEVLAVIFFHEEFQPEKGIALGLSLWGFVSYFYGEIQHGQSPSPPRETELPSTLTA